MKTTKNLDAIEQLYWIGNPPDVATVCHKINEIIDTLNHLNNSNAPTAKVEKDEEVEPRLGHHDPVGWKFFLENEKPATTVPLMDKEILCGGTYYVRKDLHDAAPVAKDEPLSAEIKALITLSGFTNEPEAIEAFEEIIKFYQRGVDEVNAVAKKLISELEGANAKIKELEKLEELVTTGNPAMKTATGRLQFAQLLLENGLIKAPEQLMSVLKDGVLNPLATAQQINTTSHIQQAVQGSDARAGGLK
jgi:hypothetical protein